MYSGPTAAISSQFLLKNSKPKAQEVSGPFVDLSNVSSSQIDDSNRPSDVSQSFLNLDDNQFFNNKRDAADTLIL